MRTLSLTGLTTNNNTIAYVRKVPENLKHHPFFRGKKNYRKQLGHISMTEQERFAAWSEADQDYTQLIKQLQNVNLDVIESNELVKKSESYLRINNLKAGLLSDQNGYSEKDNKHFHFMLKHQIEQLSTFDDLIDFTSKEHYQSQGGTFYSQDDMPSHIQIQEQAWKMLTEPAGQNQRQYLFSDCWSEYVANKGIDETTREGKRNQRCFNRFIEIVGDKVITEDTANDALVTYVEAREAVRSDNEKANKTPSPSATTITRELTTIMAALRVGIKRFRLRFPLDTPEIKKDTKAKKRHTFTAQELVALMNEASDTKQPDYQPFKELMFLIMVQTGTHITELLRLTRDRVKLEHAIPHIILSGDLKTEQRQRVIPLVYRVDRIKELAEFYNDTSEFFFGEDNAKRSADNYSTQLNKICKRINPKSTSYSCRHSFKHHAMAHGIDALLIAALGGWSGKELGLSRQMIGYGASGLLNHESLKRLQDAMLTINSHLIDADMPSEAPESHSKLIYLHQRKS